MPARQLENQRTILQTRIEQWEAKIAKRKQRVVSREAQRSKDRTNPVVFNEQHMETYLQKQKDLLADVEEKLANAEEPGAVRRNERQSKEAVRVNQRRDAVIARMQAKESARKEKAAKKPKR